MNYYQVVLLESFSILERMLETELSSRTDITVRSKLLHVEYKNLGKSDFIY